MGCYARAPKISSELFTLTYGAIVMQLIADYDTVEEVNVQLDKMGYNIGVRLIDEFLSQSRITKFSSLKETADLIAKVGFKMFLGVTANVGKWSADEKEFSLTLDDNPFTDFVDLPEQYSGLLYSNMLCGVIRGALEMVQMKVTCSFISDALRNGEILLKLEFILRNIFLRLNQ